MQKVKKKLICFWLKLKNNNSADELAKTGALHLKLNPNHDTITSPDLFDNAVNPNVAWWIELALYKREFSLKNKTF